MAACTGLWSRASRIKAPVSGKPTRDLSQDAIERMVVARGAEFKVVVDHRVALVAAELLGACRVSVVVHAGAEFVALEAVTVDLSLAIALFGVVQ